MMLTAGTIGSYTLNYMTTYALDTLHLPATISFSLIILNGGLSMGFEALSGWLSDRFGRKPVMIIPGVLLVLAILPCFWVIDHVRTLQALYGAEAVMVILAAISSVPVIVTITETLPPHIRSGAVATIYAFAISIFGGSTQFVIKLLIDPHGQSAGARLLLDGRGHRGARGDVAGEGVGAGAPAAPRRPFTRRRYLRLHRDTRTRRC